VVSLWDNLSVSARRYPKKTALAFFDCRITYEELAGEAERLAAQLAVFGVRRGDRVLVVMQNCPQLVIAHYAIFRANAVVVPVNPMNRAEELRHYITDAQATIAITTGDLAAERDQQWNRGATFGTSSLSLQSLIFGIPARAPAGSPGLASDIHCHPCKGSGSIAAGSLDGNDELPALVRIGMTWPFFHTRAEPPDYPKAAC
jgi:acyl-CoA synthetase (AMP-forming)/AMP-acid ligase II